MLIAGDLVPYGDDVTLFKHGDIEGLLGKELFKIWSQAGSRVFNLETPLINHEIPLSKCGPNLKADEKCINGITKLKPSTICLANNHILDYGESGLNKTVSILKENGLSYVGVGKNLEKAIRCKVLNVGGKKVAVYNTCEMEFSVATKNSSGAFGYDEGEIIEDLIDLKKKNDYVVVIYHGGKEHYRYPSPLLQKRCRLLVRFGADLVVCQHSHCIGCMEKYDSGIIIYGQGNFIFNKESNEFWNESLIVDASFGDKICISYIPIVKQQQGIRIAEGEERERILREFKKRSEEIKDGSFVDKQYNDYSKEMLNAYLFRLHGNSKMTRILYKLTNGKVMSRIYNGNKKLTVQNMIECESHRESIIQGLKCSIEDEADNR